MFKLSPRLSLCANMVRDNKKIVDIGTDHAYLPIWLAKARKVNHAIAADVKKGPLNSAIFNIKKYHVENIVETRLSNGLTKICPHEVDDIIIAGMGGELIIKIINGASWIKNGKRLILQPMSHAYDLRKFLIDNSYDVFAEKAVLSYGRVYTVLNVGFKENITSKGKLFPHIGLLEKGNIGEIEKRYILTQISHLKNKILGLNLKNSSNEANELKDIVNELKNLIK